LREGDRARNEQEEEAAHTFDCNARRAEIRLRAAQVVEEGERPSFARMDKPGALSHCRCAGVVIPATIEDVKNHSDRADRIWADIERIRAEAPVIHNITNYVVMNTTANALLAIGASPVMAHAEEEVGEMAAIARALVINIGTLSAPWIAAMFKAGEAARRNGRPIILDPVGAGGTTFRTVTARKLLAELSPAIVRGNASEIRALVYDERSTRGVDSAHQPEDAADAADALSTRTGCVVVTSGAVDLISSGGMTTGVGNGHPMMAKVTGMGCTASALAGAFAAVNPSARDAAVNAMAVMGIAGELAADHARGPGTFLDQFLDALYLLNESDVRERVKVRES
jgi:hydroxyethylthiazole kinase